MITLLYRIWCRLFTKIMRIVWGFSSHSRIFHTYGDVTMTGEGLQILTYARHSWPLSSKGSLACHTYCDKGHSFRMVISEVPWPSQLLPSVWQWSCHYLFLGSRSVAAGNRTANLSVAGRMLLPTVPPLRPMHIGYSSFFISFSCRSRTRVHNFYNNILK